MTATLLVLHRHAERFRQALAKDFPNLAVLTATTRDEAIPVAGAADAITALDSQFHDDLVRAAPRLRWIHALTSGTDVIAGLTSLDRSSVTITTTRGIHGPQMSEITLMHMLALTRRLPRMLRNQQAGEWERWEQPLLWRKTVVIFGIGAIAADMARYFSTLGMTVLGISHSEREEANFARIYPRSRMLEAVSLADYLVILAPHSPENNRVINAGVLAAMKPGAFLINVSRGGVVDEDALLDALRNKRIAGAGLDVFSAEPLPRESPFWSLDNVIISPRVGGMSDVYVEQCLPQLCDNLRAYIAGDIARMANKAAPRR